MNTEDPYRPVFIRSSIVDRYLRWMFDADAKVYLALARHIDHAGVCYPGLDRIGQLCNLKKRTVQAALSRLIKLRLVRTIRNARQDDRRGSGYELLDPPSDVDPLCRRSHKKGAGGGAQIGAADAQIGAPGDINKAPPGAQVGAPGGATRVVFEVRGGKGAPPPPDELPSRPPPDASPHVLGAFLAALWAHLQSRRRDGRPLDPADAVAADVVELLRRGLPCSHFERLLLDPARDRGEYWSDFRARASRSAAAYAAHRTRAQRRASPSIEDVSEEERSRAFDLFRRYRNEPSNGHVNGVQ